ncbi:MAG: DUF421 domain-containing protein [Gemmatirosa sp.]
MTVAVTLALGSTLATVLVSEQISLARGIAAFVVLLSLQYAISWLSVRSRRVQELVRGEAALLFHGGEFLDGALRRERVTPDEVRSAARDAGLDAGLSTLADVEAAVLETDGSIAVVRRAPRAPPSSMAGVRGYAGDERSAGD